MILVNRGSDMEKTLRMSLLFDFYGSLLTERQREIYQMYFHEDLSLGEIGGQLGVSRQAVYDILKRSAAMMEDYEQKLSLITKDRDRHKELVEVEKMLRELRQIIDLHSQPMEVCDQLDALEEKMRRIISES